jgi:hypothetical protein
MPVDEATLDAWKLDSGLRSDMVMSIHSAYFAPHADYQSGQQLLLFLLGTDENEEPYEYRMSVGADWQSPDGGNTIVHPTKKQQRINGSTIYGHWISFALQIPELAAVLMERGAPTNASIWIGLQLHLTEQEIKFGRNIDSQQRLMPVEYFGLIADSPSAIVAPVATAPVATAPTPAPAPAPAATDPAAILAAARAKAAAPAASGSPLYDEMVALAKSSPDFPTFLAAALADDRVLADDELAMQCADEAVLYASAN